MNYGEKKKLNNTELEQSIEAFLEENKLLNTFEKKALFFLGVLSQHLLDYQYHELENDPFRSRLNGLKIDTRVVQRLLPEIINKFKEYKKNYYRELEKIIGEYLLKCDFRGYTVDQMSFYFALGITQNKQFKSQKETKITNKEDNNEG